MLKSVMKMMNKLVLGKPAPAFTKQALMPNGTFGEFSLEKQKGKYVCLLTYPLDFTMVCPTELLQYSDAAEEFSKLNCQVVAASVDSVFSHLQWTKMPRNEGGIAEIAIPIISDLNKSLSTDYGVLIPEAGIALRGVFLIDPKGVLRQITVNETSVGRNVDETLRLLQAIQHVDTTGEVAPCGWRKGKKAMKPSLEGVKDYFKDYKKEGDI